MEENEVVAQKLISAVQDGNLIESESLIKELNGKFFSTWSPGFDLVCQALKNKQNEMAKLLIFNDCLLRRESQKTTALHVAVLYADVSTIQLIRSKKKKVKNFISRICSTRDVDENGMSALHLLAQRRPVDKDCAEVLEHLLYSFSRIDQPHCVSGFTPMHFAAECANLEMIPLLLQQNAQVDSRAKQGETPLHIAIANGHVKILRELLRNGADPNITRLCPIVSNNQKRPGGYTTLHIAAENENLEIFQILLEQDAKPEAVDELCRTPLHIAVRSGSLSIVTALLNTNCEISSLFTLEKLDGYSPLHVAVDLGNEDIVKLFLDKGISVDSPTQKGYTCLHLAARKGNTALARFFQKCNVNSNNARLTPIETPLFFAAESGCLETVEVIYKKIKRKSEEWLEGYASLLVSAYQGHEKIVQMMLDKGAKPNANFGKYMTPLQAAAQKGHETIVNLLLEHGAEVNPREDDEDTKRFSTPLIAASLSGHKAIVKILLDRGADINVSICSKPVEINSEAECLLTYGHYSYSEVVSAGYNRGYLPIHFGVVSGKKEIVIMFLEKGVDVDAEGKNGETPLSVAVKHQLEELVAFLLEKGANADAEESGESVLLKAISINNLEIVQLLIKFRASVNKMSKLNEKTYRPLELAITTNTPENSSAIEKSEGIVHTLIDNGASLDFYSSEGLTPLFLALKSRNIRIFKLLLMKGASIDEKTTKGKSILQFAIENYIKLSDIEFIVQLGANLNEIELNLLSVEMHDNCAQLFKILCNFHLDVNTHIDSAGKTILHRACDARRSDIVQLLLKQDANVNTEDNDGRTPFWYVVHATMDAWYEFYNKVAKGTPARWKANNNLNTAECSAYKIDSSVRHSSKELIAKVEEYVKIARLLTLEVLKLQAAGKHVNIENILILNYDFVKDYAARGREEIMRLKNEKIVHRLSYFDLFSVSELELVTLSRNYEVKKNIRTVNRKFRFYETMLKTRYEIGRERRCVTDLSTSLLNKLLNLSIEYELMDVVFSDLHMIDLRNFCRAFNPYIFVK